MPLSWARPAQGGCVCPAERDLRRGRIGARAVPRLSGLDASFTPDGQVKVNEVNRRARGTIEASAVSRQHRVMAPGYPAATRCSFQGLGPDQ